MPRHLVLAALLALQPLSAVAGAHGHRSSRPKADVLTTAARAPGFSTLIRAIAAAELDEALRDRGPYTVFAPTDEAFAKLPSKTLTSLLKPENRQELRRVLLFHVVSGRVDASKARKLDSAKTLAGPRLALSPRGDSGLKVGRAKVVSADIGANNGIIHVIDRVLLPPDLDLVETASKAGKFRTLLAAAEAAGLVEELTGQGPLTLLAPTDSAFDKLPKGTVSTLLEPENRQTLRLVLSNHILHGRVYANEAIKAGTAKSAAHRKLRFGIDDGRLTVDGARVIRTDIDATNGVVHVIDRVLVPE